MTVLPWTTVWDADLGYWEIQHRGEIKAICWTEELAGELLERLNGPEIRHPHDTYHHN